jgi:hypothetical protein
VWGLTPMEMRTSHGAASTGRVETAH